MIAEPTPARPRSPLTDPRALVASAAFHAVALVIGSLLVLGVSLPKGAEPTTALNAQIGPVDNRVPDRRDGGGAPGALGGGGAVDLARIAADRPRSSGDGSRDAAAESVISGVLPGSDAPRDAEATPSGPPTSGFGLMPGEGAGGGGGTGGGIGGGAGPGVGPGTEFFGTADRAASFAFVIDCSGSMAHRFALKIAKAELLSSLERLPPDARFGVIFYNMEPTVFRDDEGRPALLPATADNKARVRTRVGEIRAEGGTNHRLALEAAIALKPEVIYFLTDAERMAEDDAEAIRAAAGAVRIQAVEFGDGPASGIDTPLRTLATSTGGSFRHVDLSALAKPGP